jgi:hypothetical protein
MYITEGNASMPRHRGGRTGNISGAPEDATGPNESTALESVAQAAVPAIRWIWSRFGLFAAANSATGTAARATKMIHCKAT